MLDGFTVEDVRTFHLTILRQSPGNSPFIKVMGNKLVKDLRHAVLSTSKTVTGDAAIKFCSE